MNDNKRALEVVNNEHFGRFELCSLLIDYGLLYSLQIYCSTAICHTKNCQTENL